MESLTCELSPAALLVLYRMLREHRDEEAMQSRAALLGEDVAILEELEKLYAQLWAFRRGYTPDPPQLLEPVGQAHGQLASWFLSVLRGPSADFSYELRRRCQELLQAALAGADDGAGTEAVPTVIGWSLGSVSGNYDRTLPVIFAETPSDVNVRLAYSGLAEHVLKLGKERTPWSELQATAIVWRCAGIAEGILPRENLESTLRHLTFQAKPVIPDGLYRELNDHWADFRSMRNALTHVAAIDGERSFSDLNGKIANHEDVRLCLLGITYFVADSIRENLSDPDHDSHRTAMLSSVRNDLAYLYEMNLRT